MKRVAIAVVGMFTAFSLVACGADSESPEATKTVTVAPEPTDVPELTDETFADFIRDNTSAFDGASDEEIVNVALAVCNMWETGASVDEVIGVVVDSGVDPYDGGFLAGAGTEAYCPEYSDNFDSGSTA